LWGDFIARTFRSRRKLQAQLEGTGARGSARGGDASRPTRNWRKFGADCRFRIGPRASRPKQACAGSRTAVEALLKRPDAGPRCDGTTKTCNPHGLVATFGTLVDGLKAATTSPDTSPISLVRSSAMNRGAAEASAGAGTQRYDYHGGEGSSPSALTNNIN